MNNNPVLEKSFAFALRIVKLYRYLVEEKREFVLSKELLNAGTNIGKHVKEATSAENRQVFISEFGVARRKASETEYWLLLIFHGGFLSETEFDSIEADRVELIKLISSIFATSKQNG
jgi:four helix bundle protein